MPRHSSFEIRKEKTFMKKKNNVLFFTLVICTVMTVFTCKQNIGLGGTVDIERPDGQITYPDAGGAPIRGSFVMKGTAKDDEGVKDVSVVFKNKDTGFKSRAFDGKLTPTGGGSVNWEIEVKNDQNGYKDSRSLVKDYPIPDGEYEATVTITDVQGKKTLLNQTYKIDNTPPVFIVSRPSTIYDAGGGLPVEQYGSKLRIVGEAGDIHSLDKIRLNFPESYVIEDIVKDNKESSINIVMAEHENSETGVDYEKLKKKQDALSLKTLQGKLIVSDNAREYSSTSSTGVGPGNQSEFYYIKNHIEKEVLSKGYTAKVIHDYFAGKIGDDSGSEHEKLLYELSTNEAALDVLRDKRILNTQFSSFKIDPNKTPGFIIVGYKAVKLDRDPITQNAQITASQIPKSTYSSGGGSNLTFELYQNKDRTSILSDNTYDGIKDKKIKIELYKGEGSSPDAQIQSLTKDNFPDGLTTKHVLFNASGEGSNLFNPSDSDHQKGITFGDIIKIERQLPSGFAPGVYRVRITGKDALNNEGFEPMISDTERSGYVSLIKFEISAPNPVIYPDPIERYYNKNSTLIVKADVESLDTTRGIVQYWFDNNSSDPTDMIKESGENKKYKTNDISISRLPEGNRLITISASDPLTGTSALRKLSFIVDKTKPNLPELTEPSSSGAVEFGEWNKIFVGKVSDHVISAISDNTRGSGISKVTWRVGGNTDEENDPSENGAKLILSGTDSDPFYKWEANVYFSNETDNYLHVWVYDGAGNISYKKFGPYTVKTDAPIIEHAKIKMKNDDAYEHDLKADTSVLLGKNNKNQVKLEIKAKTGVNVREISSVEVKIGASTVLAEFTSGTKKDGVWTADLSHETELTGWNTNNGSKKFKIIVKDGPAPHRVTTLDGSFVLDTEDPDVKFSLPLMDNSNTAIDINKKITISGSITDNKAAKSIKIVKGDGGALTEGVSGNTEFTVPEAYTWSFKLDTTRYPDNTPLQLKAIVEDKAGNKKEQSFTLKINQDADRPVITVNSFNKIAEAALTGSRTLMGTIRDDDGRIDASKLKIKIGSSGYNDVQSSAGGAIWTYTIPNGVPDGELQIDFKVTDADDSEFNTGIAGNKLNRPKVIGDKDQITDEKNEGIKFKFDTKKPEFKNDGYKFISGTGSDVPLTGVLSLLDTYSIIGNSKNRISSFRVWVKDSSGIKTVSLAIGAGTPSNGTYNSSADDGDYKAWDIKNVTLTEGNLDIKIKVTDNSGYENEVSIPVIIDFTAPVIEQQSPSLDGIYFNDINITGSITDTALNNGRASGVKTETIEYKIGRADSLYTYGTSHNHGGKELSSLVKTSSSWIIKIPDISKYKDLTGVISPTGSGTIYTLPITIKAADKAGNVSIEKTYNIKFDPNGGTPTLAVVSPKKIMEAGIEKGETIGGDVVISGSAAVANPASGKFVTEITLQLRKSGQSFGTSWSLDGKNYGTGYIIDTNTAGIQYWNHILTQAVRDAIFTGLPAGTKSVELYFRVKGKNSEGKEGEWTDERKFILSKDVAEFYEIKLDGINYAPTDKWIKGDTSVITGKVKHEQGIKSDIHTSSPASLPAGTQSLNNGCPNGFSSLTEIIEGANSGYAFTVPIKTNNYTQKSGFIEFDITATDKRTQNSATVSSKIMLKYDNSKPAVVFGRAVGKFKKASFSNTSALGVSVNLEGTETVQQAIDRLKKNLDNLVLFAETKDGSAKAVKITNLTAQGSYARADFAATTDFAASANCILLEQNSIVFDKTSNYYQLQGFAYDIGSKTKTVKIEFNAIDKGAITKFDPESGNFVSFTQTVQTNDLVDGKYILKLTPTDAVGNDGSMYSCNVFVRNRPLKITDVSFSTDLDGNGNYTNNNDTGLVETVKKDSGDGSLNSMQNYNQILDIAKEFTIKNAGKSRIKFTLEGGEGLTRNFIMHKVSPTALDPWKLGTVVKNDNLTNSEINFTSADFGTAANKINDGDNQKFVIVLTDGASESGDTERKLTLKVTLNVKTKDTRKPSAFVAPFYWNGEGKDAAGTPLNSLPDGDRTKGHIEIKKVSSGAGESDVSGQVVLRGTAYHPTKLTRLELTVDGSVKTATNTSGIWSSSDALEVTNTRLDVNGHWVKWEYTWTTGTPGNNKQILLKAYHNTVVSANTDIGSIVGKNALSKSPQSLTIQPGDTAVPGQFIRIVGRAGSADEDVSYLLPITAVNGSRVEWKGIVVPGNFITYYLYPVGYTGKDPVFNKPAMSVNVVPYVTALKRENRYNTHRSSSGAYNLLRGDKVTVKGFNLTGTVKAAVPGAAEVTVSGGTFDLSADAKSGKIKITAGGVEAVNNLTNNSKPYNRQTKAYKPESAYWTDDIEAHVWKDDEQFPGSDNPIYPAMAMGTTGKLFASFSNYSDSRVFYSELGKPLDTNQVIEPLTWGNYNLNYPNNPDANPKEVFYAYDPPEETALSIQGEDTVNVLYGANYHGGTPGHWNSAVNDAGGLYCYDSKAKWGGLGSVVLKKEGGKTYKLARGGKMHRFELFYHNKQLQQFKNFRITRGNNRIHIAYYDTLSNSIKYATVMNNKQGNDSHEYPWINLDGGSDGDDTQTYTDGRSYILSDTQFEGLTRSDGTAEYCAIALDGNNKPVVVYADVDTGTLRLARASKTDPTAASDWKVQKVLTEADDPNIGIAEGYFTAKFDSEGKLHIAFRNTRGQLCYIKSKNANAGASAYTFNKSVIIDDAGSLADLSLDGTIPYISYMSKVNAYDGIRIARYDDNLVTEWNDNGTPKKQGAWNIMTAGMKNRASNVRTCIAVAPNNTLGWKAAVGYTPGNVYRVVKYIGE